MTMTAEIITPESHMSVASFLREKREESGLTQKALADRSGIGLSTIKQYERETGGSMPTIEKAAILADILGFDARNLFDEALGRSTAPSSGQHPSGTADKTSTSELESELHQVEAVIKDRGISAKSIPRLVSQVMAALGDAPYQQLLDVAAARGLDTSRYPHETQLSELGDQARNEACELLEGQIIVNSLYGRSFETLPLADLRELHKVVAKALDREQPLRGVPMRNVLGDIFSDDEDNERLREEIVAGLPIHLADAASKGHQIIFKFLDPNFGDEQNDAHPLFQDEPNKFEVAGKS